MRIVATEIRAKDLLPGELFSSLGPDYWESGRSITAIGEKVYIRTEAPSALAADPEAVVYKITVIHDEQLAPGIIDTDMVYD